MSDPLISRGEAAALLKCKPSSVSRMVTRGELEPAETVRRPSGSVSHHLFNRRDVMALKRRRDSSTDGRVARHRVAS